MRKKSKKKLNREIIEERFKLVQTVIEEKMNICANWQEVFFSH